MNKWLKICLVFCLFAIVSVALFFILKAFNITDIDTLKSVITKTEKWGKLVFVLIQVFMLVCFCFVPVLNPAITVLGIVVFGSKWAYILCLISICFSSTILFLLGDKFGEKLVGKLIGKSELDKVQNVIDAKSKLMLPLSFIIPGFPDEAFCIVAGMTKMKYWYFILVNVLCHAIEIGIICFLGSNFINWKSLSAIDWIIVANLIIVDIYLLFKLEKFIENRTKTRKNQ